MLPSQFPLGASFVPSEENAAQSRQAAMSEPVSEAIKYLSLRLPRVVGARSLAANPLIQPHITGGLNTNGYPGPDVIVQQVLNNVLGPDNTNPIAPPQVTPGDRTNAQALTGGQALSEHLGGGPGNPPMRGWGWWGGRAGR